MASVAFTIVAYLIGSLSFAVIVSRAFGLPDPHTYGSGNPGATNVLRTGKKLAAVLTLLGDTAKGWFAVFLARLLAPEYGVESVGIAAVVIAAFLGHVYPVYFRFKGGKGVATALGILLAVNAWLGLAALGTWVVIAAIFRISSLAALLASLLAPCYYVWFLGLDAVAASVVAVCALLVFRHKENIRRLLAGEESRIGSKG